MPPTQHASLGASGAYRWMACPGSPRMEAGRPGSSSTYAREGTAAHDLAERALAHKKDPEFWLGEVINVPYKEDGEEKVDRIVVTEEMCEAVQVYVAHVRALAVDDHRELHLEQRVSLERLGPPEPMYGTADAIIWDAEERHLFVDDYKHGKGVVVEVEGNPQPLYYALGAVLKIGKKPKKITMQIIQPRAFHPDGPIRSHTISYEELIEFKNELMDAADATTAEDAPLVVGDHCKFCKALAVCPAQRDHAVQTAQSEFMEFSPPDPEELTLEELALVLERQKQIEDWLSAVNAYAVNRLDRGLDVPGHKLVPKRARRYWVDEDKLLEWLERKRIPKYKYERRKLKSPAQLEKLCKSEGIPFPDELVEKKSSGPKLAPADDPRPALTPSAVDDFEATGASE